MERDIDTSRVIVSFTRNIERSSVTVTLSDVDTFKALHVYDMALVEVHPPAGEEIYITNIILAICGVTFDNGIPIL